MIVCAGDVVDYGRFPDETISLLSSMAVPCVRGNHDRWAIQQRRFAGQAREGEEQPTNEPKTPKLSAEAFEFLGRLPSSWWASVEGVSVAVHHASPQSDTTGIYPHHTSLREGRNLLFAAGADVLLGGHTHVPFALHVDGQRLIANPGALLRARGEQLQSLEWVEDSRCSSFVGRALPTGGTFGVLELPSLSFSVFRACDGHEVEIPRIALGTEGARAYAVNLKHGALG
jgi:predicted phosphodiesterase